MTTLPLGSGSRGVFRRFAEILATGLGAGYMPWAPGSFGTLVGVPLALLLAHMLPLPRATVIVGLFVVGVPLCEGVARALGEPDPGRIVWDEIVGLQIALFQVPAGWLFLVLGFVLFRLFDIFKPFPLRRLERLPGGLGIMADDVGAGVYALVLLEVFRWWLVRTPSIG